jgi:prepilin-type N-terminal cleavage/methylation domain-containing protein
MILEYRVRRNMHFQYRNKLYKAFTLAEVLITLLIIGVISSVVIPAIMQDSQQTELKTAWKKAIATISQAAKMQKLNEGQINVKTIKSYMNVTKDCSVSETLPECEMDCPTGWEGCNRKPSSNDIFITTDGTRWGDFNSNDKWCVVDVNGVKGPNKANKDTFVFCIMPDGRILPDEHPECNQGFSPNAIKWLSQ